ncbi:OmpA family protein [Brumimicrobium sp.]|uniref:OmpA family protein n=1 Tax=Brumimicrobium sp. TaxID=2029867 RepID=UPI003A92FA0F
MRLILGVLTLVIGLGSCVPAKKYNDLLAKEQNCSEELKKYKTSSLDYEAQLKTVQTRANLMQKDITQLKSDTTELGKSYRSLQAKYQQAISMGASFEKQLDKIKDSDAKHLARMRADLEAKIIETQRKEDALLSLEKELKNKQVLLADREQRVAELEEMISRQEMAVKALESKIAQALRGFENKGLKVEERNGKIYVSLEAKLLFASGSTFVEAEGRKAIIQLARAIEGDDQLEIIVEGHTDTDRLASGTHPKNNWELSVLRATSVVGIMTENTDINPAILSASGRSQYHPVDANDKSKNRRIEVIIAPRLDALFELISK